MDRPAAQKSEFKSIPPEQSLLHAFFSAFLDETAFADFRHAERLVGSLKTQGSTVAGYPIIRPGDCALITKNLSAIFEQAHPHFRTHDRIITERFEQVIGDFHEFCQRIYPGEAMSARILRARVRLFMGDADGVLELVSHHAHRLYLLENPTHALEIIEVFARAHMLRGTLAGTNISFIAFGRWFAAHGRGLSSIKVGVKMAPFVALGADTPEVPVRAAVIRWASRAYLDYRRERTEPLRFVSAKLRLWLCAWILGLCYRSLSKSGQSGDPFSMRLNERGRVLVARAMGGIGDLLMMAPGLEATAKRYGLPVDFAIPRKFFPIFAHNPHVNLLDIDGPPIDIAQYRRFYSLSLCPASRYESRNRPDIRKGRVETFAQGMGVGTKRLRQQGWRINHFLSSDDEAFCDDFLRQYGIGKVGGGQRPLVGIQPYSRDSYKDHPGMIEIIEAVAKDHDVLVFHHVADGLPSGAGIVTTAGLPLGRSLALVSRIEAMVSIDSAFLHAAGAFDIPVVAMFGPTDGRTLTRHHKRVKVLWQRQDFGCVPCWRNEDLPCKVTGLRSASPCIAAIRSDDVVAALGEMMGTRA